VFCYYLHHTIQTYMPPAGFEPVIPACELPPTLTLDRSATGIGFDPRTVQPVASHYTDWAIPALKIRQLKQANNRRRNVFFMDLTTPQAWNFLSIRTFFQRISITRHSIHGSAAHDVTQARYHPWATVRAFQSNVLQLMLGFCSPWLMKVLEILFLSTGTPSLSWYTYPLHAEVLPT
jgi:hypothetical protein